MKLPESVFDSLLRFRDKIKVSFQKVMKTFGPYRKQPWLKLLMTGNGDPHGSSLTLTNGHGIFLIVLLSATIYFLWCSTRVQSWSLVI